MKLTYKGKLNQMIQGQVGNETATDLTGSMCDIVVTIEGEDPNRIPHLWPGTKKSPKKKAAPKKKSAPKKKK